MPAKREGVMTWGVWSVITWHGRALYPLTCLNVSRDIFLYAAFYMDVVFKFSLVPPSAYCMSKVISLRILCILLARVHCTARSGGMKTGMSGEKARRNCSVPPFIIHNVTTAKDDHHDGFSRQFDLHGYTGRQINQCLQPLEASAPLTRSSRSAEQSNTCFYCLITSDYGLGHQ